MSCKCCVNDCFQLSHQTKSIYSREYIGIERCNIAIAYTVYKQVLTDTRFSFSQYQAHSETCCIYFPIVLDYYPSPFMGRQYSLAQLLESKWLTRETCASFSHTRLGTAFVFVSIMYATQFGVCCYKV